MTDTTIDQQAEALVRLASRELTDPHDGECLACYVARMISEHGCDTSLRFACRYRDLRAPRATGLERRLGSLGGFCDCEIFLNGLTLADHLVEHDETGDPVESEQPPMCAGVRGGSIQPCASWVRLRRR